MTNQKKLLTLTALNKMVIRHRSRVIAKCDEEEIQKLFKIQSGIVSQIRCLRGGQS